MSHYFRLRRVDDWHVVQDSGEVLNVAAAAWHRDFALRAKEFGYDLIVSLSYELFASHCPGDWQQRAFDGSPGGTGWEPPSALLSPANAAAMAYLQAVARAFVALVTDAGLPVRFQVGEPWWWTMPDGRPCLYDPAAAELLGSAAIEIPSMRGPLDAVQRGLLDAAGAVLAESTAALTAAVRAVAPEAETLLLAYLPTILDPLVPEAKRANLPVGWARPAFDVLQLEDYDWCALGNPAATARGVSATETRLGYPTGEQHYLAASCCGLRIARNGPRSTTRRVGGAAAGGGPHDHLGAAAGDARRLCSFRRGGCCGRFRRCPFPDRSGSRGGSYGRAPDGDRGECGRARGAQRILGGARAAATTSGPGVRSEADVAALLAFFRARMGAARAFRLRDPFDWRGEGEVLGFGDGATMRFALVKHYDGVARRITRPVAASVIVTLNGAPTEAFTLEAGGHVALHAPAPAGAVVAASFDFDVAVRFAEDRLTVHRSTFLAGEAPSVPLVEVAGGMSWLDGPLTTAALCWRIERRDGVGIGLTAHDRDLVIDGNRYRAAPGMTPSAIRRGDPAEADTMDVAGALTSGAIAEADLIAGRWDGARVAVFAVDWTEPSRRVPLGGGVLGAIETADGGFTAEVRGLGVRLDAPACEVTSPECRAELGDRRCRVPMAGRRTVARVVAADGDGVTVDTPPPFPDAWSDGRLRWLDGAHSGVETAIVGSAGSVLTLATVPHVAPQAGDRAELIEGCDKSLATCAARFNNAVNFRGEPYLPGIDLLTRYPGA